MKCLIIAAGRGSKLERRGECKPLMPLLGKPIIERIIRSAVETGILEFFVVAGYLGNKVRKHLDTLAQQLPIKVTHIENKDWENGNGLSILKAQDQLNQNFILIMGNHLLDPVLLAEIQRIPISDGEVLLAVDRNLGNSLVDFSDVTKVRLKDRKIISIGKDLNEFDGFDTGVFLCSPEIFQGLVESINLDNDASLSGGIRCLCKKGKVKYFDTNNAFWVDVDDEAAFGRAEKALLKDKSYKLTDGPVSRYINRNISRQITKFLARSAVTPNQISLASFLLSVVAAILILIEGYPTLAAGGIIAQFASILDGCDGEIARLKFQESTFGEWLDAILDRYADALLLFALSWHAYQTYYQPVIFIIGFLAIIGSFMVSYTAVKHDILICKRSASGIRVGRDIRIFIIFIGTLLNQALLTLALIAAVMNAETLRRIYIGRNKI